jgi:hypothetical protein
MCSKHFSYSLKGKMETKIPVPMPCVVLLTTKFYRLKCWHAPTGINEKLFGHREDDKCWWCGGGGRTAAQMQEHLFHHCSQWRDQQTTLWKALGNATARNAGRCRHVQITELFSKEECDQVAMNFLAATYVRQLPPKCTTVWRWRRGGLRCGEAAMGLIVIPFVSFLFSPCVWVSFAFVLSLNFHIYQRG